jgi:thiol:disulfide interchange protein
MLKKLYPLIILFISVAWSQDSTGLLDSFNSQSMAEPILTMEYTPGPLNKGSELIVQVILEKGWKITSHTPADEFLYPASIQATATGVQFAAPIWPEPVIEYIEALAMDNSLFADTFLVRLPIQSLAADYDSLSTTVKFSYQACNNMICLSPATAQKSIQNNSLFLNTQNPTNELAAQQESALAQDLQTSASSANSLWLMFLFAFLGGVILNLMPCVLPVLSLKLMSLVKQANESKKRIFHLGLAMTAGVLVSFWALALAIVLLQQAGELIGWGFQFQSPLFLVFMISIVFVFALNLFGVFEIILPGSAQGKMDAAGTKEGLTGAFFKGVFMTLLSTPCSAPLLGPALGFAFSQSAIVIFAFFTVIGLGLALPYMVFSVFPQLARALPKPGMWMVRLRQFMGFTLLATGWWLLSVFAVSTTTSSLFGLGMLLLVVSGFLWVFGFFIQGASGLKKIIWTLLLLAAVFYMWTQWVAPGLQAPSEGASTALSPSHLSGDNLLQPDADGWIAWTPNSFQLAMATNQILFLDFTADWCLTCKINEKGVLSSKLVLDAFEQNNVLRLKADWTRKNEDITKMLREYKRSAVPVYVVYHPHQRNVPIILPEVLTQDMVLQAITKQPTNQ